MSNRAIVALKWIVFPACLIPLVRLIYYFQQQNLGADPVNTITHSTGDWTMYFLLLSLAMTPLRRLHRSLGWLIRFRRMLGLFAFFYGTLHLSTYVFLYSGFDVVAAWANLRGLHPAGIAAQWQLVWPTILDDLEKRKFIQVGLFAWTILLALAVTSPVWIMRKMGGKNWQRLHRLVYVAAIAGVIHYWWLVKAGVRRPMLDTEILGVLLLARIVWVLWKRWKQRAKPVPANSAKSIQSLS